MKYIYVKPLDPAAEEIEIHFDGIATIRLTDEQTHKLVDALNTVYFDFEETRIEIKEKEA